MVCKGEERKKSRNFTSLNKTGKSWSEKNGNFQFLNPAGQEKGGGREREKALARKIQILGVGPVNRGIPLSKIPHEEVTVTGWGNGGNGINTTSVGGRGGDSSE